MRWYWLFTVELVPVDHEYCGQSLRKQPLEVESYARVIESPADAIEFGSAGVAAIAAGAAVTLHAPVASTISTVPLALPAFMGPPSRAVARSVPGPAPGCGRDPSRDPRERG
jgi:hypothetical protein